MFSWNLSNRTNRMGVTEWTRFYINLHVHKRSTGVSKRTSVSNIFHYCYNMFTLHMVSPFFFFISVASFIDRFKLIIVWKVSIYEADLWWLLLSFVNVVFYFIETRDMGSFVFVEWWLVNKLSVSYGHGIWLTWRWWLLCLCFCCL